MQESLLRILERLDSFEGRSRFTSWAMAVTVRTALTELRRKRWGDVSLEQAATEATFDPEGSSAGSPTAEVRMRRAGILRALKNGVERDLTPRQRTAILAELGGMPQVEVARRMGTNPNALYKLAHDARRRLKASLTAAGYSGDELAGAFES